MIDLAIEADGAGELALITGLVAIEQEETGFVGKRSKGAGETDGGREFVIVTLGGVSKYGCLDLPDAGLAPARDDDGFGEFPGD